MKIIQEQQIKLFEKILEEELKEEDKKEYHEHKKEEEDHLKLIQQNENILELMEEIVDVFETLDSTHCRLALKHIGNNKKHDKEFIDMLKEEANGIGSHHTHHHNHD